MEFIFQLSKEDLKLAKIELNALFEIYNIKFKVKQKKDLLFVNCKATEKQIYQLCNRSAMIHWCSAIMKPDFSWIKSPFLVRIKQGKGGVKEIASKIWKKLKKPSVDLENG